MKHEWKRSEYVILEKTDSIKAKKVKGIITGFHGWTLGIHKTKGGIWLLTDLATGCQIRHRAMLDYEDTQKDMKRFIDLYEQDLYEILDTVYKDTAKIEQLKKLRNLKTLEMEIGC